MSRTAGGTVVTHVGASMCVEDVVEAASGKVVRVRVGDAYITEEMERRKAVFGGEPIGAWIFPEVHMCPDGILGALKLLQALEERDQTLSQFVSEAPEYPTRSAKIEVKDRAKTMKGVEQGYRGAFGGADGQPRRRPQAPAPRGLDTHTRLRHRAPHKAHSRGKRREGDHLPAGAWSETRKGGN